MITSVKKKNDLRSLKTVKKNVCNVCLCVINNIYTNIIKVDKLEVARLF